MPAYAYRAVDLTGRRIRGREDAPSPTALTRSLEARGLVLLDLAEGADGGGDAEAGFRFGRGQAVLDITRAVAALLAAGLPLARALKAAAHVATGETSDVVDAVRARVERGDALAAALAAHPRFFPPLYVGLVRAGERSGDLAGAFRRLAAQLERDEQLRARLLSLSLYPLILAVAGAGALAVLIFVVLPRFAELLTGTGAALPRSTAAVLAAAHAARTGWPLLLAAIAAVPLLISWARRTDQGRRAWARLLLDLPLVRRLR
ncbi:MAG TPA: type II secretion system F family protein, partial [Vicinamibacteria bacterium]